jgi:hypothetical protein
MLAVRATHETHCSEGAGDRATAQIAKRRAADRQADAVNAGSRGGDEAGFDS